MTKHLFMLNVLCSAVFCLGFSDENSARTFMVRQEVASHTNPNITKDTHPTLFGLVENLAIKAHTPMPRYISTFGAEYNVVTDSGYVQKGTKNIEAYVDFLGDLHICRELLTSANYEELEVILALAIADKAIGKHTKLAATGVGSYIVSLIALCMTNSYSEPVLRYSPLHGGYYYQRNALVDNAFMAFLPALFATKLRSNYLQKEADVRAAHITSPDEVIRAITVQTKINETYNKENIFMRFADWLHVRSIFNTLFYPVRAYTDEERIEYVQRLKK